MRLKEGRKKKAAATGIATSTVGLKSRTKSEDFERKSKGGSR